MQQTDQTRRQQWQVATKHHFRRILALLSCLTLFSIGCGGTDANDADEQSAALELAASRNFIINPGFESGRTGWTFPSGNAVQVVSGGANESSSALRVTADGSFHGATQVVRNIAGGATYSFSMMSKTSGITAKESAIPQAALRFRTASGSLTGDPVYLIAKTTSWTKSLATAVAPANATTAEVMLYTWKNVLSGQAFFDNIVLQSLQQQTAVPQFNPAPGTYAGEQNVTLTCATANSSIYYTTDGTTPSTASALYSGAIAVTATTTIKAMAHADGYADSQVATGMYSIDIGNEAKLAWGPSKVDATHGAADGYRIYRCSASGTGKCTNFARLSQVEASVCTPSSTECSYTSSGLTSGSTYCFQLTAYNSSGESAPANCASKDCCKTIP